MPPQEEPPPPAARWPRFRSRRSRIAVGAVLLLAVFIAVFDATWLRPLIQHHIQERSGRRVDFDELHIGLNHALQPTVRLHNLVVQNAPWAARSQPFVRAGEVGFTFAWRSLRGPVVVTQLALVDAELDLEHRADGLRNWRLTRPDDRGPGRVRVQAIDARNTRAHVIDGGQRLSLDLQVTVPSAPAPLPSHPALPLVREITLKGTRDAATFEAQLAVSGWPTFFDTGRAFALRGDLQAGPAHAHLEGTVADLMQLAHADVDLRVSGPRLAELGVVAGLPGTTARLPALASQASARLLKEGGHWTISALQVRIGRSDLAGRVEFAGPPGGEGRSMLRATLTSERIDPTGWRAAQPPAAGASVPAAGSNRLDADVDLRVAAIEGSAWPVALTGLSIHATQREGRSALEALQFRLAGGRASGTLTADTTRTPAELALDLRLQGLQLSQIPQLSQLGRRAAAAQTAAGQFDGGLNLRVALRSRGDALDELAAGLDGSVTGELVGASIPDALDAKLALDGGHLLRSVFNLGRERAAVTCATLEMRFDRGRGDARRLVFETPSVAVSGTGWVDLGRDAVDLLLTPRRKQTALLALDRSMRVSGPLTHPKLALVAPPHASPATPGPCRPPAAP